jgi:Fe-S-cluster containining protein
MSDKKPSPCRSGSSEEGPWYRDGLRFRCTQCGNCCTGDPGVVWASEDEIRQIATFLGKSYGEVLLQHTRLEEGRRSLTEFANGDCTFFDAATRGCKIYPVRPVQCRTWPFWNSNLENPQAWKDVQASCPGAGHGDFFPLAEIERRAAELDL